MTLVEVVVAMAVGVSLLVATFLFLRATGRQHLQVRENATLAANGLQIQAAVRGDLEAAGRGTFSAYNWAGVAVATAGPDSAARDTLTTAAGRGPAYRASVHGCQSGGVCVRVVGAVADSLHAGDVVVVGSPNTGARVYQVAAVGAPYQAACGADCLAESLVCSDEAAAPLTAPVVVGSTIRRPDNTTSTSAAPCTQSVLADGSTCTETVQTQTVGSVLNSTCAVTASPAQAYTDVALVDRSARLGYPALPTTTLRSGADGVPQVFVQRLALARYWVDATTTPGHPTLVKQVGLADDGTFPAALPVAPDVLAFRVAALHQGAGGFVRGVGVRAADLAMDAGNANFVQAAAPEGTPRPAYTFRRSYRTIAAVETRFTVLARPSVAVHGDTALAARARLTVANVVNTTPLLGGGALQTYDP